MGLRPFICYPHIPRLVFATTSTDPKRTTVVLYPIAYTQCELDRVCLRVLRMRMRNSKINNTKSLCDPFIQPTPPRQYCFLNQQQRRTVTLSYLYVVATEGHKDRQAEEICLFIRMRTFTFFYAAFQIVRSPPSRISPHRLNLIKGGVGGIARWHRNRRVYDVW